MVFLGHSTFPWSHGLFLMALAEILDESFHGLFGVWQISPFEASVDLGFGSKCRPRFHGVLEPLGSADGVGLKFKF